MESSMFRPVQTYDRLDRLYRAWSKGDVPFLAVVGRGGIGKTHGYESLEIPCHLFRGKTSPVQMYMDVMAAPAMPIVFDDIRRLMKDDDSIDLMKQICDSKPVRTIRWRTTTHLIPADSRSFECSSSVLVVLNHVLSNDPDVEAIIDRFDAIEVVPTKAEIIARMRIFARCQDDVDTLEQLPIDPTLRHLKRFEQWKEADDLDEIEEVLSLCRIPQPLLQMMQILETTPTHQRIKAYQKLSGKPYDAARREWSRKSKMAQRLLIFHQRKSA